MSTAEERVQSLIKNCCCGVKREFLEGLPHMTSQAAQLLLLPLALRVQYTSKYNDNTFYITKKDIREILGLSKSYEQEGHMNEFLCRYYTEILDLKVNGIQIFDLEKFSLPKGWLEVGYTQEAMDAFFQGLTEKYFVIGLDTITKMTHKYTFDFVKKMFLSYDFKGKNIQIFKRHTKTIKEFCGMGIEAYMRKRDGDEIEFDRYSFEKNVIKTSIEDLQTIMQFQLYKVEGSKPEKPVYMGKTKISGTNFVENYYFAYSIIPFKKSTENFEEEELA